MSNIFYPNVFLNFHFHINISICSTETLLQNVETIHHALENKRFFIIFSYRVPETWHPPQAIDLRLLVDFFCLCLRARPRLWHSHGCERWRDTCRGRQWVRGRHHHTCPRGLRRGWQTRYDLEIKSGITKQKTRIFSRQSNFVSRTSWDLYLSFYRNLFSAHFL